MKDLHRMFAAHSPAPGTVNLRFEHCFSENISIATLIKASDNIMPAFEHSHDDYEFVLPLTPIPYLTNEGAVYFGEVGRVFPVQSGRKHGIKHDIADVSHRNIVIRKEFLDSIMLDKEIESCEFNYDFRVNRFLKIYIEAFREEYRKGDKRDTHKLKHLSSLICVEIIDAGLNPDIDIRKEKSGYQKGLHSIAEFLNKNYQNNISVAVMAQICGLSPNYFSKCFEKLLGDRPQVYLTKLRISKAKQLLEESDDTIESIAAQCGFRKPNSLTSAFKTATGTTPTEYRANC